MEVVAKHLKKVYNTHQTHFVDAAKMLKQRKIVKLDEQIIWKDFLM